jgi:hypothetical protein
MLTQTLERAHLGSVAVFAVMAFAVPAAAQGAEWRLPANEEIHKLIAERNAPRLGQGIVIAYCQSGSRAPLARRSDGWLPIHADTRAGGGQGRCRSIQFRCVA